MIIIIILLFFCWFRWNILQWNENLYENEFLVNVSKVHFTQIKIFIFSVDTICVLFLLILFPKSDPSPFNYLFKKLCPLLFQINIELPVNKLYELSNINNKWMNVREWQNICRNVEYYAGLNFSETFKLVKQRAAQRSNSTKAINGNYFWRADKKLNFLHTVELWQVPLNWALLCWLMLCLLVWWVFTWIRHMPTWKMREIFKKC